MITSMLSINMKFIPHAINNQSTCQFAQLCITNIQKFHFNINNSNELNKTWSLNSLHPYNSRINDYSLHYMEIYRFFVLYALVLMELSLEILCKILSLWVPLLLLNLQTSAACSILLKAISESCCKK